MRRDPARMSVDEYDVVVVGGGIYGACVAWEAALTGLKVALIEAGDFGHATSANSLRTLHGGLRHLQRFDFSRMRESIRARREWLQLAPHLARPMRFALPTFGHGLRGPEVMRAALRVNDLISFDRNRAVQAARRLPAGRVWSEQIARVVFRGTDIPGCNGAAIWYDAVCSNTERLLISVVGAAVSAGAVVANYVRATELLLTGAVVSGVRARDELTGQEHVIRAQAVVNATGPRVGDWISRVGSAAARDERSALPLLRPSKAFNLLTRPLPFQEGVGLSVPALGSRQTYFVLPWNGRSLIGTRHLPCAPTARSAEVSRAEIQQFLADLNPVLGRYRLSGTDVLGVFAGLLPEDPTGSDPRGSEHGVELQRAPSITAHDGQGLFSIVGVKWTTSLQVAERAVNLVARYLGKRSQRAHPRRLFPMEAWPDDVPASQALYRPGSDVAAHLEEMYGPTWPAIQTLVKDNPVLADPVVPDLPVIQAQVVHAIREEMAIELADIVMRRTPLYLSDALDASALETCASIAARELRWTAPATANQIERTARLLRHFRDPTGDETYHARTAPDARPVATPAAS
jgi:glycerol-3-phosphate dehydrogenase